MRFDFPSAIALLTGHMSREGYGNQVDLMYLLFEEYAYDGYNTIGYAQDSMEREVILYSITEDYYKYMRSVQKDMHRDDSTLGDLGIYEPIFIHNSVDGGAGALCAQSSVSTMLTIE